MDLLNPDPEQGVTIDQSQPIAIAPQQEDVQQEHVIVPEKEHDVPEPKATPKPEKKEIGCFTFATIIISCFLVSGPLAYFLIEDFFENGNEFSLYVGIFFIVISIGLCILFIRGEKNDSDTPSSPSKSDSGLSLDATASAITMGLMLGGKKDQKSDSDSLHDSLFWQEKYRKDKY